MILVTMLVIVITLKIEKPKEQCEKVKLKLKWSGPPKIAQKEGGSPLKRIKNILFFSILT